MKTELTITDLTRMSRIYICAAGYTAEKQCVRPVLQCKPLPERLLWKNEQVIIRPFAVVEFDLVEPERRPPHTEDWIIRPSHRVAVKLLTLAERRKLLNECLFARVADIFETDIFEDAYVREGTGTRSLGTVRPKSRIKFTFSKKYGNYRLGFYDRSDTYFNLSINDLALRSYLDHAILTQNHKPEQLVTHLTESLQTKDVYLRIGLARSFKEYYPDRRCYLQVTGVYSFPDYLQGKCFADFAIRRNEDEEEEGE